MRVLILSPVYPHAASPSEGVFNKLQAEALARRGVDCTVIVCKPQIPVWVAKRFKRYSDLAELPRSTHENGVAVYWVRHAQLPSYLKLERTVKSLTHVILEQIKRLPAFDLIHVQSVYPVGLAAPRVALARDIPFLVTLHIQDDQTLYGSARGWTLYSEMLRRASVLVAVGTPLERFIRQLLPADIKTPILRIPNGVELGQLQALMPTTTTPPPPTRLVSVGNLWALKGIDYTLRALRALDGQGIRDWCYTIVGDGPERQSLTQLSAELDLQDRVRFTGSLPHSQALAEIAAAHIFILPSWNEAFGVVYLEALACGKPAIGCWTQGAQDIIQDGETGLLVQPRDVPDLTRALTRLIRDPKWAASLGALGKQRALAFTWDANAARYAELYTRIVQGSPIE